MAEPVAAAAPWHAVAFNSGSSSLKFGLYEIQAGHPACVVSGEAHGIGEAGSVFRVVDASGRVVCLDAGLLRTPQDVVVVVRFSGWLVEAGAPAPQAIGHRVVHGGPMLRQHCRINDAVLRQLDAAKPFAPLHTPAVLSVIRSAQAEFPGLPEMAFSTPSFMPA